jgi:hypothetical protein
MWYFATALISVVAFAAGLRLGRRRRRGLAAWVVVLTLLLAKGVLNKRPAWEFALFPWPFYIYLQGYIGFPLGLCCLGIAAAMLPRGRKRNAVLILAAFTFAVSAWTERWMLVEPDDSSARRADADHHCIQSSRFSCGPAVCVTVLSSLGVEATEGEMMRLCRTPPYWGTSLFRIARGLRLKLEGLPYEVRIVDGDAVRRLRAPAVVAPSRLHAVAVLFEGDVAILHDPLQPHGEPGEVPRTDAVVVVPVE